MNQKKALQLANEFAGRLKAIVPDFKMRLYGSYARGQATSDSDIDIYIEVPQRYFSYDLKNKVTNLAWELSFLNETVIQISLFSDEQVWNTPRRSSPFINSVMKEGILI
jgi:predicted nucleotidyltransferase